MPDNAGKGSNFIRVDPGKGWWLRLPVPTRVAENLGGVSQLRERLRPVVSAQFDMASDVTPVDAADLAGAYANVFQALQEIPAVTEKLKKPRGRSEKPGVLGDDPITVDPGKGRLMGDLSAASHGPVVLSHCLARRAVTRDFSATLRRL